MIDLSKEETNKLVQQLLVWYDRNKRILPWRDKHNAYYTWVSEIMLQQTRVEAVKPYFERFVTKLPNVRALAECPEEQLLKLWEGLGYYSRVRNLQTAAIEIMEKYDGVLPADHKALLGLKGIGRYTAGAIASIAYGIPVPAVDGNVLRVMNRITESYEDISKDAVKKEMETGLMQVIPADRPGDFNQALMELGAVICVPNGMAKCVECSVNMFCLAYKHGTVNELPVKKSKKSRKIEERTVFVIQDDRRTIIRRRPEKGLLAGMYELPNTLGYMTGDEALSYVKGQGLFPLHIRELPDAKHIFSHIEWRMKAYQIRVADTEAAVKEGLLLADKDDLEKIYAIPSAFSAYSDYTKK